MGSDRKPRIVRSGPITDIPAAGSTPAAPATGSKPAGASTATSAKVTLLPFPGDSAGPETLSGAAAGPAARSTSAPAAPSGPAAGAAAAGSAAAGAAASAAFAGPAAPTGTVIEFPEPAFKRRRRTIWITAVAVLAAMAAVVAVVMYTPVFALTTITVDGTKMLTPAAVQSALEPLQNKPLTQISQDQVWKLLEPLPQARSVSIEARPPHTLLVHLVERVPVALLKSDSSYLLVDPDGVRLGSTADPSKVPLPLIDGGTAAIGKSNFKAITAVLAVLPPEVLGKLLKAGADSPDAVQLTLDDGKKVIWGNSSEQALKAKVLQALLKAQTDTSKVSVYDISSPRRPVTR
ncbi:MAG: cell division protein FtsQ/DivIB [Actinomycetales bacterium]